MREHLGGRAVGIRIAGFMIISSPEAREPIVNLISSQAISCPED